MIVPVSAATLIFWVKPADSAGKAHFLFSLYVPKMLCIHKGWALQAKEESSVKGIWKPWLLTGKYWQVAKILILRTAIIGPKIKTNEEITLRRDKFVLI